MRARECDPILLQATCQVAKESGVKALLIVTNVALVTRALWEMGHHFADFVSLLSC